MPTSKKIALGGGDSVMRVNLEYNNCSNGVWQILNEYLRVGGGVVGKNHTETQTRRLVV